MIQTLLFALALQAPSATPPPKPPEDPGWRLMDGTAQIVNDDLITWSALAREVDARRRQRQINSREDELNLQREVRFEMVQRRLWAQAGAELGLQNEQVEVSIDRVLDSEKERTGLRNRSARLAERQMTLREERKEVRDELLRGVWRDAVVGRQPGALGRVTHDAFVRPGELSGLYLESPELLAEPDQVRLQVLVVLGAAVGGLEEAREHAETLRQATVDGADFDQLVEQNGALFRDTKGRLEPLPVPRLPEESWRAFAESGAQVGDVSGVLELHEQGALAGYQVVKLLERIEGADAPSFTERDVQRQLGYWFRAREEEDTLSRAHSRLVRASYFWPDR